MYVMIKMKDLFGLIKDWEKIIHGIDLKLILKRKNDDIALFRVNAGGGAVRNGLKKKIET